MRFFLDTEFDENGSTIKLISIALVSDLGHYYACLEDGWSEADCDDWVKANVLPKLPARDDGWNWRTRAEVADDLRKMLLADGEKPEIWGYFADYDWVALCQLFGRMVDLPKGMPMFCRDLEQLMEERGVTKDDLPKQDALGVHDALADARWIREAWLSIQARGQR